MSGLAAIFPRRLLAANLYFTLIVYAIFVVVVMGVAVAIGVLGDLESSVWERAVQAARWYVLVIGITVVRLYLPVYVAHGRTRREFAGQAAVFTLLFAPAVSALTALGYLLEGLVYRLGGWPHQIADRHLFGGPGQVPLVLAEYWAQYLVWVSAGVLLGAAFYRLSVGGVLLIPVAAVPVILVHSATDLIQALPIIGRLPMPDLPGTTGMAITAAIGGCVLVFALTWTFIRDMPIRNPG
ncbi:hypothetical protein [Spongiactinospora sp. 9N601]|uniref:hypothetical protein n=1 Tax=Spongiactinospora sp. 9N601 TaxID=3375149 RepID=UPI0037B9922C